jgi:hypothetical protein
MRAATTERTSFDGGIRDAGLAAADVTDEELAALAMAADPDVALDRNARSLFEVVATGDPLLPEWYMPALPAGHLLARPWQRRVVVFLVGAFLLIEAYGLCTTYGPIGPS